jgi:hypothetical protein|nr:hypothetical protein [uncultured Mediterranean phage uvMED]
MLEEDKIDVGEADEQTTEIDLDAPAPEQSLEEEIQVEEVSEDSSQPADASEKPDEQSDVQKNELNEYSEGVNKRIAKLTRKMREAERQKEEAITYAQQIKTQADRMKNRYDELGGQYTSELEQKVTAGLDSAKAKLKQAIAEGDVDAQIEAQRTISQMTMEEARLKNIQKQSEKIRASRPAANENIAQMAREMPTAQDIQQAAPVDPKANSWAAENTWFGTDNAMTYTAFDIHRRLVEEEGFDPQSDEYYSEVDKRIRLEFPHKFDTNKTSTVETPVQTVASAKRPAGKGRRKTVKLTPSQVAISKRLGVPLEEYAKQLAAKEV